MPVLTPRIGITLGDPAGIGPEIVATAVASAPAAVRGRLVVIGDRPVIDAAFAAHGGVPGEVDVADCGVPGAARVAPGRPDDVSARAQVAYLDRAVALARAGEVAGLVTAPIAKAHARRAGFDFPGHTEFLADRLGAPRVAMMFAGPRLNVVLATVHVALAEVPRLLSIDAITGAGRLGAEALARDLGVARPRVAVAGLNPHAGEGGLFGTEEIQVVAPAVEALRAVLGDTATVDGPRVPDVVFREAADGRWDLVVALYHDQGLIPVKVIDFEHAVNVTLGLPIVRTSPDHGVAYDIAGTGAARDASLRAALALCVDMVDRRERFRTESRG